MRIAVNDRQSLFDIALQTCGSIEAVFELAEANGIGVTDPLVAGQVIEYGADNMRNKLVVQHYVNYHVIPSTAITPESKIMPEGIEYWNIELDFKVS